ncbi:type II secretion system F family protein [Phenylobacterium sp.]|jgi:tight adherence protein C|uniref:type II secretion system F family protein n=1 Tax=Phenylobacterium sp. TaxID=1871053 RepID=UPI000C8E8211|nr:type II secretion system F family protein [Phenylobacterium sp.]MAK82415.1 type II secretion system protein [Phenylobacterium sp.]|tara:strand:- start:18022 stop:19002 length:981 start_codon:yes stop_codon:yes gene_type:complete
MDLSAFTNPANILTVFVAVATFATLVTLAAPLMRTNNLEARLKSVSTRREELRRKSREALAAAKGGSLRQTDAGLYKRVVDRLELSRLLEDPKVVDKLAQAGFRGPRPVSTFYFFRFVLPFAFAASVAFYLFVINDFGLSGMNRLAAIVVGLTLGYYAPNIYISNIAQKRRESIVGAFPDALDLLLICVESGMSIEAAIQKVSQEIGGSSIELAEEMTLLTAELSYLPERRQAYEGLSRRTNHPGIKSVTTAMIQAERYGTPLGAALRVMAKENRDLRLAAAEKKAAQLPAKLTVPMIVFFLPVLFLVILGPAVLRVMDMMAPGAS